MNRPRFIGGIGSKAHRILDGNRAIIIADEPCWDCDGEGHYLQEVSGGYYDSAQEQWYPDEEEVECETCHGEGVLFEVERCGRCGELADECECDEDDLEEWLLGIVSLVDQADRAEGDIDVDWNTAHYIAAAYKREVKYERGKVLVAMGTATFVGVAS
jgi:RecJ-like exonuclease